MDKEIIEVSEDNFKRLVHQATLSTCHRSKCGSLVVTKTGIVIGSGYNSMPCNEVADCFKDSLPSDFKSDKTCCIHAEQRAIMQAVSNSRSHKILKESTVLFIRLDDEGNPKHSGEPYCTICSKFALDSGIGKFALWHKEGWTAYETNYYNKLSFEYGKQ